MKITVYGTGCARCRETEAVVRSAIAASGVAAEVEHVSDMRAIVEQGILMTPTVAVDGLVKVSGRVPSAHEVRGWLGR